MTRYEMILAYTKNDYMIHPLMLNSTKEIILESTLEELAEIINTRCEKQPCNFYCNNCGRKGVPLSECKENIIKWLEVEL